MRWRFVPEDGEKALTDAELAQKPHDFLEEAFRARLEQGPVRWDMIVTIGEPGDSEDDPTILWPSGRREVRAGTLTLISSSPDEVAGAYNINFDPMVMADGVEPTNDPVLRFRSSSYAISHSRRLTEVSDFRGRFFVTSEPPTPSCLRKREHVDTDALRKPNGRTLTPCGGRN